MSNHTPIENKPSGKGRLWQWFKIGFGIVFVGLGLFWPIHFYDGESVRQTVLCHYYLLEIQLALNSSGYLGPTSGNTSEAAGVLGAHIFLALIGGLVSAGIGWATRKKPKTA